MGISLGRLGIFAVAGLTLTLGAWLGGAFEPPPDEPPTLPSAPVAQAHRPEAPRDPAALAPSPQAPVPLPDSSLPRAASRPPGAEQATPASPEPEPTAPREEAAPAAAAAPRPEPAAPRAETVPAVAPRPEAPRPRQEPPRFDVARVGARGALVTAGRAAPGAEVVLWENGREIGRGRADARGEWVILPDAPLSPGPRELTLTARLPGGEPLAGEASVVLLVPEPPSPVLAEARPGDAAPVSGQAVAEAPATASASPLALLLPAPGVQAPIRALQAPAAARLSIDLVDYAGSSGMRFAGAAPAGAQLRLYIDDAAAGEVLADAQGRWSYSPATQPTVGRHVLRADQLGAQGQVVARVEQPFQRAAPPANLTAESEAQTRFVVQPGHNLWRIARGTYGQGIRYTHIFAANRDQIRNPHLIYPGQVFTLPAGTP